MRQNYNIVEGVVVDTSDPQQMGRMKVWCPSVDGDNYNIDTLPWTSFVTPLGGQTRDFPAGSKGKKTKGLLSYGFWAIPKVGAAVLVILLYNSPSRRFYLGSYFNEHGNRSLPAGRNRPDLGNKSGVSDTFDPVEPQSSNLAVQFDNKLDAPEAITRGAYERQVAQDKSVKDGAEGYEKGVVENGLDPQTYCMVTPGHHALIMQDNPKNSRMRIKTADGHQIIFDDANERIYVSTAKGNTWIELDSDGHVHVFGSRSVSISAGEDLNLNANNNVNIAGENINIAAGGSARVTACADLSLSGKGVSITSGGNFNILASGSLLATGSQIHLNGPGASEAACASLPTLVPGHEPWERPASKTTRNPNWKK
jgi:hypothetical protein